MASPSPPDPAVVFSVRIVSIDYYISPPIPGLDFCYTASQGLKVEEVPVIRIYGSTPAGQKACLHIHRALPYLYIPCPDDLLHSPEEGHAYLLVLSHAIEKALSHKTTPSKRHVHGCSLVRAKKLYGYHSSEELFIKIYLYYPHEVAYVAKFLLGGNILNRTFQPYESHIPYLLQFLIDYNLYGMSYIHTSKFKFRPPLPDVIIPKEAYHKKHDTPADLSSAAAWNSSFWLSSTVSTALVWSDSATGHDVPDDKSTRVIKRQSICCLELDSSIDDIQNEKYKLYTSLSQTGSDVKMVQSLIPIWEEEYERSGVQGAVKSPDTSKPPADIVLKSFEHGHEYENALSLLCLEAQNNSFEISAVEEEDKLEKYIKSCTDIGSQRFASHFGNSLKYSEEECKSVSNDPSIPGEKKFESLGLTSFGVMALSETIGTEETKNLNNEALGLLSWLASSQAVEDLNTDDELVREAIVSPLLQSKSYKKAMELAHLDYENASQQECQDILDSVEVPDTEKSKEQTSFAGSLENLLSVSSGNAIQQVDGSSDDNFRTPQKHDPSKIKLSSGKGKSSSHHLGKCTSNSFCGKDKKKILWGPLPVSINEKEHSALEKPTSHNSSSDSEIKNDSESSSSSGSKERYHDVSKAGAGIEAFVEKIGKITDYSVRDLMRRKRCFRADQTEPDIYVTNMLPKEQKDEIISHIPEDLMHPSVQRESTYVTPCEPSHVKCQDGIVQDSMVSNEMCTQGYILGQTGRSLQANVVTDDYLGSRHGSSVGEYMDTPTGSRDVTIMAHVESVKPSEVGHRSAVICTAFSGCNSDTKSTNSQSCVKCATIRMSCCKEHMPAGHLLVASCACARGNADNLDESLKSYSCSDHVADDGLRVDDAFASNSMSAVFTEPVLDARKYANEQDGGITPEKFLDQPINFLQESDSALNTSRFLIENHISGEFEMGTSSPNTQFRTCTDMPREKSNLEYIEMAFSGKPPSRDQLGRISEDSSGISGHVGSTDICDEALAYNYSSIRSNGHGIHDLLPFFIRNPQEEPSSNSSRDEENFHRESALGVPSHFQNDGSVLYLLTHSFSPPTFDSVQNWLLEMQQNSMKYSMGACKERIPLLPSSSESCLGYNNDLRTTGRYDTHMPCNENHWQSPSQEYSKGPKIVNHFDRFDTSSSEVQVIGAQIKENVVANSWQDLSQISGPDAKSNLTPLSQIGFRDPASLGGGQQLTLMSMEIQAESRGDLRPDPQFDPINIISLAIQEDRSPTFEVYVIMRGNNEEPCKRNVDGVCDCKFIILSEERQLLEHFVKIIASFDPDVIMGWEIQGSSLGYLAERAAHLGIGLLKNISRTPQNETTYKVKDAENLESLDVLNEPSMANHVLDGDAIISDEWGRSHASGIHVGGRIVLNVWRLMRAEIRLSLYTVEAVAEQVLRRKIPLIPNRLLNNWFSSGAERARYRCIEYVIERVKLNIQIMNQLDMINRTSELARVFGIDFFSVLSRGSQFRVESMLLRLAHTQNYLAISPGGQQVASQPAMECLPLVMEPESGFYVDPVIVLDFQSLYPSMIIAYNLCYSTCLGKVVSSKAGVLGVSPYSPEPNILKDLKEQILLTPNGVMYLQSKVRQGVLPRLLEEILSTRIMVKQAMKKLTPSQQVLQRIFNARQLALKLIANVTYGYTAAGFSGRMPCAEIADSIVQCGRRTLETAIALVNQHDKWNARVIYGDTDSMFVLLKGRNLEEAFRIGNEIAASVTAINPYPVTLKMEKVYRPCFLLTKKRYVGYSYESPVQEKPTFDAKGIETVRRDTCPVVAKTLEQSIRLIFEHQDMSKVKLYLQRQWTRILSGKFSLQDFIFAKEVRLGTYRAGASSLPPAAIVAIKATRLDPRAEPRYGERVPYVVIHGEPGARLIDMVIDPCDVLDINSPYRLNDLYYISKQIIPALQRLFGLLGADLYQWFSEMPRPVRPRLSQCNSSIYYSGSLHEYSRMAQAKRSRIDRYYVSKHCTLCGELVQQSAYLCDNCSKKQSLVTAAVVGRTSRLEREIQHLSAICRHCGGGDWIIESGVKCISLACSVFYERRKVQKELQALATFATEAGFYPTCMAEWF